jgi:UDP-N-acetylmuramate: L-alanyl-gamma-D-glutamyl-meso-diaminopimelate ligase
VLTSVEFDHADIYRDLDHVRSAFGKMVAAVPSDSLLISADDDPNVAALVQGASCRQVAYGTQTASGWRLGDVSVEAPFTRFQILKNGADFGTYRSVMIGMHNLKNTLAAVAVADSLDISAERIGQALATFKGVRRRQEIRGHKNGVIVMDDFAHHPTAVKATLLAVKNHFLGSRIVAVFEPRTQSSMRRVFQHDYAGAFDAADRVFIRKPSLLSKVPEGERFSSRQLVADLQQRGKDARHHDDTDAIIAELAVSSRANDVILIMSNGGFDNIHERLLACL